jgi:hypothetical protein
VPYLRQGSSRMAEKAQRLRLRERGAEGGRLAKGSYD